MDEELIRQAREAIANFPPKPDLNALCESGDITKVPGGYQALTEKGQKAIEKYVKGIIAPKNGGAPIYQLSIRRKCNP